MVRICLNSKSQLLRHAPDDYPVNCLGILLVVNGKQGYAPSCSAMMALAVMTRLLRIMVSQRKNIYIDSATANGINQPMLIGNMAAPKATQITLQRFRLSDSSERVCLYVSKQGSYSFQNASLAVLLPIQEIFVGLGEKNYFHISSSVTTLPFPFLISSCPCRMISAIAGEDIRYSVSSIACFWATIFFRALTAFLISPSSSDITCKAPKSSELSCNCIDVIVCYNNVGCKDTKFCANLQLFLHFFLQLHKRKGFKRGLLLL